MLEIREIESKDLTWIKPRPYERDTLEQSEHRLFQILERMYTGPGFTVLFEGKILFMVGVIPVQRHVVDCWLISTDRMKEHWYLSAKTVKTKFFKAMQEWGYTRYQTQIPVHHVEAQKWLRWLGFEQEGIMRQFSPFKEDCILFAKVIDGN